MAIPTFTKTGAKATTPVSLDKNVFNADVKSHKLLKDAYNAYLANGRINLSVTKTRGEVRGGGRKPWKQKGTGRARFGSSRVPLWTGGGITFGPTGQENYSKKINTKAKRLAIRQALSLARSSDKIIVIDEFADMNGKTKDLVKLLDKVGAKGRLLCVVNQKDESSIRATKNVPNLKVRSAMYLNVYDIMDADKLVFSKKSLDIVSDWLKPAPKPQKREAK